jgi:hypothetical protein
MKNQYIFAALIISFGILAVPSQSTAQSVTVKNISRPFSAVFPDSWIQQPTSTGNSRIKFAAPTKTPAAECAVIVMEFPALRDVPQSTFDQGMIEEPNSKEMAAQLSASYNNVKVFSSAKSNISGYPAQLFNVQYSVGTPTGEIWNRGIMVTTATTPGLMWVVGCGGLGSSPEESQHSYSYWQSEIIRFPTNIKIKSPISNRN